MNHPAELPKMEPNIIQIN